MRTISTLLLLMSATMAATASPAQANSPAPERGQFIVVKQPDGPELRAFAAGPADARAGVLVVHDYLGISEATQHAVERLGGLGYRTVAIDLYGGKSAATHEEAVKMMQALKPDAAARALQTGLDSLKRPGRKLATVGFSMGGQHALNANLNDPDAVSATVMIYGFGFDTLETQQLQKLKSPVLVISGSEDQGATDTALHYFSNMKTAKRACELFIYPGVDHGYMQPLFNGGKNYNPAAAQATWVVVDDFLARNLAKE